MQNAIFLFLLNLFRAADSASIYLVAFLVIRVQVSLLRRRSFGRRRIVNNVNGGRDRGWDARHLQRIQKGISLACRCLCCSNLSSRSVTACCSAPLNLAQQNCRIKGQACSQQLVRRGAEFSSETSLEVELGRTLQSKKGTIVVSE